MENTIRTTHNLAAVLLETSARLNNKANTISENLEYHDSAAQPASVSPTPTAANDVLNRAIDNLLALENTLDRIHESIGRHAPPDCATATGAGASTTVRAQRTF